MTDEEQSPAEPDAPAAPAGALPPVLNLLTDVFEDFRDHFVDRLVSGLGIMVVYLVLMIVTVALIYGSMIAGVVVGIVLEEEAISVLGALVGVALVMVLLSMGYAVLMGPMHASLGRAVLGNLQDGSDLTIMAPFSRFTVDMGKVIGVNLLITSMTTVGLLFCYVPGLAVIWLTSFAVPGVIVHRLSPIEAIRRSVEHVVSEPVWHLGLAACLFGVTMVLSYIPLIGAALMFPFLLSLQLRAYTSAFGFPETE